MNQTRSTASEDAPSQVQRKRLFIGACIALTATSVAFAVVGDVMGTLKEEFVLSNLEVGWIGGAALWGFAVSQLIFSPLVDNLGFRFLFRLAFLAHLLGVLMMILAPGFTALFLGALIIAIGNGLVEAAGNPLVVTLYPENKAVKLNQFHFLFPGGIALGGVAAFFLRQAGVGQLPFIADWQAILALVLIPTILYGFVLLFDVFPESENVQAGVTMKEMFKATFASPLFLLMLFAMFITASIELGPNRWIPAVLEAGLDFKGAGILVLAYINGIMAFLRYYASEPLVDRLSPTGLLLVSAVVSGIGLYLFSFAQSTVMAFATATIFAVGVCFFWPNMLGFVNERIPKSGALGLGVMGAAGMAFVGLVTTPMMGDIADRYVPNELPTQATVRVLEQTTETFPEKKAQVVPDRKPDVQTAIELSENVLKTYRAQGSLPGVETANAMRAVIGSGVESSVIDEAQSLLGPAENYGGRISFRYIAPFSILLILIFGMILYRDRKTGGYRVKDIHED